MEQILFKIVDNTPELNLNNYTEDEVEKLNNLLDIIPDSLFENECRNHKCVYNVTAICKNRNIGKIYYEDNATY